MVVMTFYISDLAADDRPTAIERSELQKLST